MGPASAGATPPPSAAAAPDRGDPLLVAAIPPIAEAVPMLFAGAPDAAGFAAKEPESFDVVIALVGAVVVDVAAGLDEVEALSPVSAVALEPWDSP